MRERLGLLGLKKRSYIGKQGRFVTFLAMAGVAVMFLGCGSNEAVHTSAQAQEENADGAQDSARDEEMVQPEHVLEDIGQTNASKAQMEIDEETRNELTAELLEENGLDTSVMDDVHTTVGCTFDLPEGFVETEDMPGMYVTDRYPLDASTIYYVVMDQDISLQLMTEETFKEQTQENLIQAYEEDVEVNVDAFDILKIDGYPAFRILCHYQVGNIKITQLQYTVNADKSYVITYSQTSDYDRMEEYEASAATIHVQ